MARGLKIKRKHEFHPIRGAIWLVLVVGLVAGGGIGYRYFTEGELPSFIAVSALRANTSVDESDVTPYKIQRHTVTASEPRYLSVSQLGISNARIFALGIGRSNLVEMPGNISDAGWFKESASPGQGYGAVLLIGHNKGVTRDGLFAQLSTLSEDDEIIIERGDGKKFKYGVVDKQVVSIEKFAKEGMRLAMQSAESGKEGVSIITTDGDWVPKLQQFNKRTILRAVSID